MIMAPIYDAGPRLGLLVIQDSEDAKDNGHTGVEGDTHQTVGDTLGNVLKVHRLALDQHANGDDGVERPGRSRCRRDGWQIAGRAA